MFGTGWLYLIGFMLLLSVWMRNGLLFVVLLAVLLASGVSWLWGRYCLDRVEYRRQFGQKRAFFGEELEFTTEIVNRKLLPLAWLETQDEIPEELVVLKGRVDYSHKPGRRLLINSCSLRWYERVKRHYRMRCDERGYYSFGPVELRSGDLFGFRHKEAKLDCEDMLIVYPKIVPLTRLGLPSRDPFGDFKTPQWLFEDQLRTVGVRQYVYGDSPRRIHWKATARTQELQVKLYEPTTTYKLAIFLNLNTYEPYWWMNYDPDVVELAICTTASIANWAVAARYQVGLWANARIRYSGEDVETAPSRDPSQLMHILELLAKASPYASMPFVTLLRSNSHKLPYGATIVVVTAVLGDDVLAELQSLSAAGHRLVVLFVGDGAPELRLRGIRVHAIGGAQAWRDLREIDTGPKVDGQGAKAKVQGLG
jgi:uncharacterized protein (DUF58 family)